MEYRWSSESDYHHSRWGRMRLVVVTSALATILASSAPASSSDKARSHTRSFGQGAAKCPARSLEMHDVLVDDETTITFLGNIPAKRYEYWIYFHDHVYRHNMRETRRIIIMGRDCRYLGQYYVSADPIGIRGNDILFDASPRDGNVIRFVNGVPPAHIWIDGEVNQFAR